jgi:hypothetical protein
VVNSNGTPVFTPDTAYTAALSSYEIDTETDFTSNMNFLIGMGATDSFGRMKPVATVSDPGRTCPSSLLTSVDRRSSQCQDDYHASRSVLARSVQLNRWNRDEHKHHLQHRSEDRLHCQSRHVLGDRFSEQ